MSQAINALVQLLNTKQQTESREALANQRLQAQQGQAANERMMQILPMLMRIKQQNANAQNVQQAQQANLDFQRVDSAFDSQEQGLEQAAQDLSRQIEILRRDAQQGPTDNDVIGNSLAGAGVVTGIGGFAAQRKLSSAQQKAQKLVGNLNERESKISKELAENKKKLAELDDKIKDDRSNAQEIERKKQEVRQREKTLKQRRDRVQNIADKLEGQRRVPQGIAPQSSPLNSRQFAGNDFFSSRQNRAEAFALGQQQSGFRPGQGPISADDLIRGIREGNFENVPDPQGNRARNILNQLTGDLDNTREQFSDLRDQKSNLSERRSKRLGSRQRGQETVQSTKAERDLASKRSQNISGKAQELGGKAKFARNIGIGGGLLAAGATIAEPLYDYFSGNNQIESQAKDAFNELEQLTNGFTQGNAQDLLNRQKPGTSKSYKQLLNEYDETFDQNLLPQIEGALSQSQTIRGVQQNINDQRQEAAFRAREQAQQAPQESINMQDILQMMQQASQQGAGLQR